MDLLFSRYASPFLLLDQMILTDRFSAFVSELLRIRNEEKDEQTLWEFFLHKVFDKSYAEFLRETKQPSPAETVSRDELEATVRHSFDILDGFKIEEADGRG